MRSALLKRFFALSVIGCVLLVVYQVVFMARTSAARDLNHMRNARLTIQQAERFVLHGVNETRIAGTIAEITHNGVGRDSLLLKRIPNTRIRQLSHHLSPFYARSVSVDGRHLPVVQYSGLFRLSKAPKSIQLSLDNVLVMHFNHRIPVDHVVQYAIDKGFKGVIYIIPSRWSPKFGAKEYPIPVAASLLSPQRGSTVTFEYGASDDRAIEKTIPGYVSETVLVGNSGECPESLAVFVEMMSVLEALSLRGWKPYRTIQFVSFPRFSASLWASDQRRSISQRGVAYIDTSKTSSVSASPLLNRTLNWAFQTLENGGLYSELPIWLNTINPPYGANVFQFDLQLPSVSSSLSDPVSTTRMLNLILMSVAMETVVPFAVLDYSQYLNSSLFNTVAASFDNVVELLKFEYTHEYPWYQGVEKLRSIIQIKRANTRLVGFEQQLRSHSGTHVVFANDRSGTGTNISPVTSEVSDAVVHYLENDVLSI